MKSLLLVLMMGAVVPGALAQETDAFSHIGPDPKTGNEIFIAIGEFRSSPEKAWQVALEAARDGLGVWLAARPTPVRNPPNLSEMLRLKIVPDTREPLSSQEENIDTGPNGSMVRYSVQVTVSPDHLRQFRSKDRLNTGTWAMLGLTAMLMLVASFFRLDEMTRGYLTAILGTGGVLLALMICYILWSR